MVNLIVEKDEPSWSINLKKAVASQLQLDITGSRSEADSTGVFGESHSAAVDTFEVRILLSFFCLLGELPPLLIFFQNLSTPSYSSSFFCFFLFFLLFLNPLPFLPLC